MTYRPSRHYLSKYNDRSVMLFDSSSIIDFEKYCIGPEDVEDVFEAEHQGIDGMYVMVFKAEASSFLKLKGINMTWKDLLEQPVAITNRVLINDNIFYQKHPHLTKLN